MNEKREIKSHPSASAWIPVAAWLPQDSGYCLCWTSGSRSGDRPIVAWFNANKQQFETKKPVTHWAATYEPEAHLISSDG